MRETIFTDGPLVTGELTMTIEELEEMLAPTPSIPIPPPLRLY